MAPSKTLLGLLLVMVALVPISYADSSPRADTNGLKDELEKLWNETLYKYEGFFIPALPTIPIHLRSIDVHVALSLANLELTGISNMKVKKIDLFGLEVQMVLPKITLKVGRYSSGGHMLNMPFSGEGPLLVALHDFNVKVNLKKNSDGHICLSKSIDLPTLSLKAIELDLRRLEVEFGNLNPGTDQGQLINIVIGAFGPEIVDYLELLINGDNKFMALPNDIFVDLINTIHCPGWVRNNPIQDQDMMTNYLYELFYQLVQDLKIPGTRN